MDQIPEDSVRVRVDVSQALAEQESVRKRQRVSLACRRCKSRKQKCDGKQPKCFSCVSARSDCQYIPSNVLKSSEHKLYISALENRIADLESELSYDGRFDVAEDHWERTKPKGGDVNSLSVVIRDLSLNAAGYYVGATTHMSLGRLLESALFADQEAGIEVERDTFESPSVQETASGEGSQFHEQGNRANSSFFKPETEIYYQSYLELIAVQYPIIHSARLAVLHGKRFQLNDEWELAILHLVYAIGACCLELTGKSSSGRSNDHFDEAIQRSSSIVQTVSRRSIVFLALTTLYCLLSPQAPGPWLMIGLAMKHCIEVGLHREVNCRAVGLATELDKRLFWTCYRLDRHTAISTGRPTSLADFDIDVSLPLDIDESAVASGEFRAAMSRTSQPFDRKYTSLSNFIHTIRLSRLRSRIQRKVYRVDKESNLSNLVINKFLAELSEWEQLQPPSSNTRSRGLNVIDCSLTIRLLLFPQLSASPLNSQYMAICAKACARVCETFKQLHLESNGLLYAPNAVHTLFLSGLTLLYCISRLPESTSSLRFTTAIYSCDTMLYVMAERWQPATRYRNAFERVKAVLLDRANYQCQRDLDEANQKQSSHRVTEAIDAFFARTQQVDILVNNVLINDQGVEGSGAGLDGDSWVGNLGVRGDAEHCVTNLESCETMVGQLGGEGSSNRQVYSFADIQDMDLFYDVLHNSNN